MTKIYLVLILAISSFSLAFSQSANKYLGKGNSSYKNEKYTDAETYYRRALSKDKQSFEANFNLGNALFRQNKYKEAALQFQKTADIAHKNIEAKDALKKLSYSFHNLGNSFFRQQDYQKSIEAYKNSLRLNPSDDQTRYNLALAQSKLKNNNKKNKQQQQNKQNKNNKKNKDNKQNQQQNKDSKMSDDNANQLLNSAMQDESNTRNMFKSNQARNASRKVEKDW